MENSPQMNSERSINSIREEFVTQTFINGIGKQVFVLFPQFPFMVIGQIVDVINDYVSVNVDTTHISEFEKGEPVWIHVDDIEVFYIEDEYCKIPSLR
ncbi:hypothetical protein [Geomicrobium sp. JCM 19055]|uniref:hypothetical protein n=1 Tax=Geomicrobium sp. JCM 19055 TaxID=1460649 RepID=UPI0009E0212F|nr:hypothetical protein [Geomicrobium sp. JCM 19055]